MPLLNPTLSHRTGDRREQETETDQERRKDIRRCAAALRHITNTDRGDKHRECLNSWDHVYVWNIYDSFLTTSCQSVSLIVSSALPVFEGGGRAQT